MTKMCCYFSPETGYYIVGMLCCAVSLLAVLSIFYSFVVTTGLYILFGSGFLFAYGVPAYNWLRSETKADQKRNQTKFIKTYLWLTGILWFLVALLLGIALLLFEGLTLSDEISIT